MAPVKSTAHVLYMDVIGSGLLPPERQRAVYQELNDVVSGSAEYRRAGARGEVICRPSGDGMALVFFEGVESPLLSALEISELLRGRPHLQLRMGIHSGEVFRVTDINGSDDVTGDGIVVARRVMDCGDAGHILVSPSVMDAVGKSSWEQSLRYLGVCQVKHGQRIALWNLYTSEVGNPKLPRIMVDQLAQETITAHRKDPVFGHISLREGLAAVTVFIAATVSLFLANPLLALIPIAVALAYLAVRRFGRR
jgi:hypothetical protein